MKSCRLIFSKAVLPLLLALSLHSCKGQEYSEEGKTKRVFLAAGETHEGWYFAAGDQVVIEGTVNGDAYIAGGVVEVDGTINGDLLVAGGQVSISGTVADDIRAAGGAIRINGNVGKNISAAGGTITIGKSAVIGKNLLLGCGSVQVIGTVNGNAKIAAGQLGITGKISGNVDFGGNNLSVLPGARINGDLHARVRERNYAEITEGAVTGKINIVTRKMRPSPEILGFPVWRFWFKILWTCSLLLTGFVLTFVFPRQLMGIGSTMTKLPGKSLAWGLVGLLLLFVVIVLLFITVIGIPLALFLLMTSLWLVYLTQLSLGVVLGQGLFGMEGKTRWNLFWAFAVGLLIIQGFTFVPYVRVFVLVAGLIWGFGAILLVAKGTVVSARAGEAITLKL